MMSHSARRLIESWGKVLMRRRTWSPAALMASALALMLLAGCGQRDPTLDTQDWPELLATAAVVSDHLFPGSRGEQLAWVAEGLSVQGHEEASQRLLRRAAGDLRRIDSANARAALIAELAWVEARMGRAEQVRERLTEGDPVWTRHYQRLASTIEALVEHGLNDQAVELMEWMEIRAESVRPHEPAPVHWRLAGGWQALGETGRAANRLAIAADQVATPDDFSLVLVAEQYASIGLEEDALATAARIGDINPHGRALYGSCRRLARDGLVDRAASFVGHFQPERREGAARTQMKYWQDYCRREIVAGLVVERRLDEALEILEDIDSAAVKIMATAAFAPVAWPEPSLTGRAKSTLHEAERLAARMQPYSQSLSLVDLAAGFLSAGIDSEARRLLNRAYHVAADVTLYRERGTINERLARRYIELGDLQTARRVADRMRGGNARARILTAIATAHAGSGQWTDALAAVTEIPRADMMTHRSRALIALAGICHAEDCQLGEAELALLKQLENEAMRISLFFRLMGILDRLF